MPPPQCVPAFQPGPRVLFFSARLTLTRGGRKFGTRGPEFLENARGAPRIRTLGPESGQTAEEFRTLSSVSAPSPSAGDAKLTDSQRFLRTGPKRTSGRTMQQGFVTDSQELSGTNHLDDEKRRKA